MDIIIMLLVGMANVFKPFQYELQNLLASFLHARQT